PQPAVTAANVFGFNLFHKLTTDKPANVFISPTSLMLAMAMVYNGAGGETKTEMAKALQVADIPVGDVNQQLAALQTGLRTGDKDVQVEIANSLWASNGYSFKPPFVKLCDSYYQATVDALDFTTPQAMAKINGWANEKTHGLIPEIVTRQDLGQAALLLIDAVYFKGKWANPFHEEKTKRQTFTLPGGRTKTVEMMERFGGYVYAEDRQLQAIALPYGTGRMNMIVVLPRNPEGLPALQAATGDKAWRALLKRMTKRDGTIRLPRFEIAYEGYLNDALKALGMGVPFTKGDFSAMGDGIVGLGPVKHKSFLRVTEKKTEAAALTAPPMPGGPAMPRPELFEMTVDHPFLLGIVDTQTGALVFLGGIVNPQETRAGE
ncbi:MAG: serpin family protein, partial [Armatimonadota bacterium]